MADRNSPFVSTSLSPQRIGGNSKFYELTATSVTPTRSYVDSEGNVVEERIPVHYSTEWVGLNGCIKSVPMRTSAVFSMDPQHAGYEQIMMRDMIQGGQLPLNECPWTNKFSFITGGALVRPAKGAAAGEDCGGAHGGCEHMKAIIAARQAKARRDYDAELKKQASMTNKQAEVMARAFTEGVGAVIADRMQPPPAPRAK